MKKDRRYNMWWKIILIIGTMLYLCIGLIIAYIGSSLGEAFNQEPKWWEYVEVIFLWPFITFL